MHRILLHEIVIDVPRVSFEAAREFWAAALGAGAHQLEGYPEFTAFDHPAAAYVVGLQDIGTGVPRIHFDIETDDVDAEVERLERLGAEVVGHGRNWTVLRDPVGLLFCVVPAESERFAELSRRVS